jgi:UDP-glucose 4-epimerase
VFLGYILAQHPVKVCICHTHTARKELVKVDGGRQSHQSNHALRVTRQPIAVLDAPRRDGDPARLVADATLARQQLGWNPQFPGLGTLVAHAWGWEQKVAAGV